MIPRPFWQQCIEQAWADAPIVWLCGVRRVGKTTLTERPPRRRPLMNVVESLAWLIPLFFVALAVAGALLYALDGPVSSEWLF